MMEISMRNVLLWLATLAHVSIAQADILDLVCRGSSGLDATGRFIEQTWIVRIDEYQNKALVNGQSATYVELNQYDYTLWFLGKDNPKVIVERIGGKLFIFNSKNSQVSSGVCENVTLKRAF